MKSALLVLALLPVAHAATLASLPGSTIYAAQTDAAGNLYVGGGQGTRPFVAKLSPSGQTLYSTAFTSSNFGLVWAIAVDSKRNAYVFGNTNSPDFPVTPGALQTTPQGQFQGFVAKLDPGGKIVYSTFVGGATNVVPGLTSAPGLDSILVDAAGDVILTGTAGTNDTIGPFPPPPAPAVSGSAAFVLKIDPTGSRILAGIRGVGGMIAADPQGNIYVTGLQSSGPANPVTPTPGAFQSEPPNVCGALAAFFSCGYQYVAKLDPTLTHVLYATYVTGKYGATPAAISVDAQGDAFVAGVTNSPDYPTTANAFEPQYLATAVRTPSCFFIRGCVDLPPASGYLTEVNPTGTGLVYSTYFSGTQTDTINFAAFTPDAIYLGGTARSDDLPGLAGYPRQCLPQAFLARLSADDATIGPTRIVPAARILAYDAAAGTLIASNGSDVLAIDPNAKQPPIACILDSADLKPVASVAPGELVSLFGVFSSGSPAGPLPGQTSTSLNGITVGVNGVPSSLLYVSGEQINFQVPFGAVPGAPATISVSSTLSNVSDSQTLAVVASNPAPFLDTEMPPLALANCTMRSSAALNAVQPLALNADGSLNSCLHPAPTGSIVTFFLNGLGSTSAPAVTGNGVTVVSVSALPGDISGVWQVGAQIPAGTAAGGNQISFTAGGAPVRDAPLIVWVQ